MSGGDFVQMSGVDELLAGSAFMLSNLWLADMLRRALGPTLPQMQNTDGEPFEFITVDHYRRILDQPIPMLGDQSPRKAATTPNGRAKVVEWLKMLENSSARHAPDDAMAGYDFAWLWSELGLDEDRR